MAKQKWHSKDFINRQFVKLHVKMLSKSDVVFDNFKGDAEDGFFCGHIKVSPRYVNYPLLCRYDAKIAALLGKAGFAVQEVAWDIKPAEQNIGFMVSATPVNS